MIGSAEIQLLYTCKQ